MGIFDIFQSKGQKADMNEKAHDDRTYQHGAHVDSVEFESMEHTYSPSEEVDEEAEELNAKLAELQRYRNELSEVSVDMVNSEGLFRASIERVKSLSGVIADTEVHLSNLARVDKENRIAQQELANLRKELESERLWAQEQEIRANTYEQRHEELCDALVQGRNSITSLIEKNKVLTEKTEAQHANIQQIEALRTELARDLEKYRKEAASYRALSEKLTEDVSVYSRTSLEMEKRIEELTSANKNSKRDREELETNLKSLVAKYNELKAENFSVKSKLEGALFEVKSAERTFGEKIKYRENELFSLRTSIEELKSQLRIREQMSVRADRDLAEWKKYAQEEAQKVHNLEMRLHDQSEELVKTRDALNMAKSNSDDINNRYLSALADLDSMKEHNANLMRKLEEYSALSSIGRDMEQVSDLMKRRKVADASANDLPEAPIDVVKTSKH